MYSFVQSTREASRPFPHQQSHNIAIKTKTHTCNYSNNRCKESAMSEFNWNNFILASMRGAGKLQCSPTVFHGTERKIPCHQHINHRLQQTRPIQQQSATLKTFFIWRKNRSRRFMNWYHFICHFCKGKAVSLLAMTQKGKSDLEGIPNSTHSQW